MHRFWVWTMMLMEALRLLYRLSTVSIQSFFLDQRNHCGWHFSICIHQNSTLRLPSLIILQIIFTLITSTLQWLFCSHWYNFLKSIGIFLWTSVWSADCNIPTQLYRGEQQDCSLMDCRARKARKGKWHKQTEEIKIMKIYIHNVTGMISPPSSQDDFMILYPTLAVAHAAFPSCNLCCKIDAFFLT